jgi:hypothetical protein
MHRRGAGSRLATVDRRAAGAERHRRRRAAVVVVQGAELGIPVDTGAAGVPETGAVTPIDDLVAVARRVAGDSARSAMSPPASRSDLGGREPALEMIALRTTGAFRCCRRRRLKIVGSRFESGSPHRRESALAEALSPSASRAQRLWARWSVSLPVRVVWPMTSVSVARSFLRGPPRNPPPRRARNRQLRPGGAPHGDTTEAQPFGQENVNADCRGPLNRRKLGVPGPSTGSPSEYLDRYQSRTCPRARQRRKIRARSTDCTDGAYVGSAVSATRSS